MRNFSQFSLRLDFENTIFEKYVKLFLTDILPLRNSITD